MSDQVRWGVLGAARVARNRAMPALCTLPGTQVHAIASRDPLRGRAFAEQFEVEICHDSYEALLDDEDVDAVYIALPNTLHGEWTRRALAAGKSVLCEKPLAVGADTVGVLVEEAERSGLVLAEGFMYRHHPATVQIAELVSSGALGIPVAARGALSFTLDNPADIRARLELGGGALLDLGCYVADGLCRLYGAPASHAEGLRMLRGNGIDEHASAVLAFPGGGIGMLDCSFRLPWIEAVFEIRGTEATLRAPHAFNPRLSASSFTVTSPGGRAKQFDVPPCDAFATMFASFNQAVLGRQPYPFLARESLNTARTLDLLAKLPTVPTAEQLG